jgi:outer membrane protein OmpA-like peptidoglycan-associated protein
MKALLMTGILLLAGLPSIAQQTIIAPANDLPAADAPLKYAVRNNAIVTGSAVSFKRGTAILLPASDRALRTVVKYLADKPAVSLLRIEGHTVCGKGDQALSETRAKAVAEWLIAHGVACTRLIPSGLGCNKPIVADHAEMNERIEFVNASLRGHAIGGMPLDGGGKAVSVNCP